MRAAPFLLVLSLLVLSASQVAAVPYRHRMLSTFTPGQTLSTVLQAGPQRRSPYATPAAASGAVQDERIIEGHMVRITTTGAGHQILVDGRILATDVDDDRVLLQGIYPAGGAEAPQRGGGRTYVLIAEQSGGNACPSMYQAVELGGGAAMISPPFGNCSDIPRVSVRGGALRVSLPAFRAARAAAYVVREGRLNRSSPVRGNAVRQR